MNVMNAGQMLGMALSQKLLKQRVHNYCRIRAIKLEELFRNLMGAKPCHWFVLTRQQLA